MTKLSDQLTGWVALHVTPNAETILAWKRAAEALEAENARLQSVIDGANAQVVRAENSPLLVTSDKVLFNGSRGHAGYVIEEQQSPAVTVPEWALSAIKRNLCPADSCDFHGNQDPYLSGGCCKPELQKAISYLESLPLSISPRITEQDAREIIVSAFKYISPNYSRFSWISMWADEVGRALLDKLNGDKNAR